MSSSPIFRRGTWRNSNSNIGAAFIMAVSFIWSSSHVNISAETSGLIQKRVLKHSFEIQAGLAYPQSIVGLNICSKERANITDSDYLAIVPESIVQGLGPRATDVPVACVSKIAVTRDIAELRPTVTAQIILLCTDCGPKDRIYLSPAAFRALGQPLAQTPSDQRYVNVLWFIDVIETEETAGHGSDSAEQQEQLTNTSDISSELVYADDIRDEFRSSIQQNSLRLDESCNMSTELERIQTTRALNRNSSHFNSNPALGLRYRLAKLNMIPGQFCNMYQNLICTDRSKCGCRARRGSRDPSTCLTHIVSLQQSCVVEMWNLVDVGFRISIPRPTNECWFDHFCILTSDGVTKCQAVYDGLRLAEFRNINTTNGDLETNRHPMTAMLRFPVVDGSQKPYSSNGPDCVCMNPNMLKAIAAFTHSIYSYLSTFSKLNILELGDKCEPNTEELKRTHLPQLRALDSQVDSAVFTQPLYDDMINEWNMRKRVMEGLHAILLDLDDDEAHNRTHTFCKTYHHLMCDSSSAVCVCYFNTEKNLQLLPAKNSETGLETCALRQGSICDPAFWAGRFENYIDPYVEDAPPPPCGPGLICMDMATGNLCPRNGSSSPTYMSYKDKIFPYLHPGFKNEAQKGTVKDYCKCGDPLEFVASTNGPWPLWTWTLILVPPISFVFATSFLAFWYHRKLRASKKNFLLKLTTMEQRMFLEGDPARLEDPVEDRGVQAQFQPYNRELYEIPVNYIKYGVQKGEGGFGVVMSGEMNRRGETRQVAIKTCKDANDLDNIRALVVELKILQRIGQHDNLVQFIGAITDNVPAPQLVLEYCVNGSLDRILTERAPLFHNQIMQNEVLDLNYMGPPNYARVWTICTADLLRWSLHIATGMAYLSDVKKILHGDLFLKNVLVAATGLAKIADFGLSRRFAYEDGRPYVRTQESFLPVLHLLPPETQQQPHRVTPQLDAWTFGVLLWEMFSLGQRPDCVNSAVELQKPAYASSSLFTAIRSCWSANPADRTTFGDHVLEFRRILCERATELNSLLEPSVHFVQ